MEDTPRTQDSTEYSWQERALKAEAELAKALQKLEYLEAQLRLLTAKRAILEPKVLLTRTLISLTAVPMISGRATNTISLICLSRTSRIGMCLYSIWNTKDEL